MCHIASHWFACQSQPDLSSEVHVNPSRVYTYTLKPQINNSCIIPDENNLSPSEVFTCLTVIISRDCTALCHNMDRSWAEHGELAYAIFYPSHWAIEVIWYNLLELHSCGKPSGNRSLDWLGSVHSCWSVDPNPPCGKEQRPCLITRSDINSRVLVKLSILAFFKLHSTLILLNR